MDNNTVDKKRNKMSFQDFASMNEENISIKLEIMIITTSFISNTAISSLNKQSTTYSIILVEILIWTQKLLLMKSGRYTIKM